MAKQVHPARPQDRGNPDCGQCGGPFVHHAKDLSTGYGVRPADGMRICFACCGVNDRADMARTGRATLYLTKTAYGRNAAAGCDKPAAWELTNWPGSLRLPVQHVERFRHPFAREAWLAYFHGPDGAEWSARNIGDSQIAHCRRLKA